MRDVGGNAFVLVLAVVLLLGGGLLAWSVQTDFDQVSVERLRSVTSEGRVVGSRLYRPLGATAATPAPGVLLIHGDGETESALAPYAIEFARRGYVVLSVDLPGRGRSEPATATAGLGGADAHALLASLDVVDAEQIVLIGHGALGAAAVAAAARDPHASVVLLGAAPPAPLADAGGPGTAEPAAELRNVAVVYGRYDEYSAEAWGTPSADRAGASPAMRALFDAPAPVRSGEIHGSIDGGDARVYHAPPVTNHGVVASGEALAPAIDWLQRTTTPPTPQPPNDQVWIGWTLGSGAALLGFVLSLFGIAGVLLGATAFDTVRLRLAPAAGMRGGGWWLMAAMVAAVPAVTFFWAFERTAELLEVGPALPQPLTNGVVGWALLNAAVWLVLLLGWWLVSGRRRGARSDTLGLQVGGFFRALLFAIVVVALAHALLALADGLFQVDARVWTVAQSLMTRTQAVAGLAYVAPLVVVFAVLGMVLHGQLRPVDARREGADAMIANGLIAAGGLVVLLLTQYVPLLMGQPFPFGEPLLTTLAIELAAVLFVAAMLSTYLFVRTGSVWPGAFVNGLWVSAYLVAGQATQLVA